MYEIDNDTIRKDGKPKQRRKTKGRKTILTDILQFIQVEKEISHIV